MAVGSLCTTCEFCSQCGASKVPKGGQTVLKRPTIGKRDVPGLEPATSFSIQQHGAVAVRVHVCCTVRTPLPSTTNPFYQPKSTTEAQKPSVGALKRAEPNGGEK